MVRHIGAAPKRSVVQRLQRKNAKKANPKVYRPQVTIVDLKGHVLGRAAAVIAKQLLLGRKITVVRADEANISGAEIRNKIKYLNFLRKRHQSNPKKGPFHHRSPSDIFCRVVRGMLPYYTKRGRSALRRLVAYEGIPANVANKGTRFVIPKAEATTRLRPERAKTVLGEMCQHIGWKYKPIVDKLEKARKEKAARFQKRTEKARAAWKKARKEAVAKLKPEAAALLKKFGVK
jgi:large subunit ribosomal protein L13Ae